MRRPWIALPVLLCVVACGAPPIPGISTKVPPEQVAKRNLLIGVWLEEYTGDDGLPWKQRSVFLPDGRFEYQFRYYRANGRYNGLHEYGDWGLSGDLFFTIEKTWNWDADPEQPDDATNPLYYTGHYIRSLTRDNFTYQNTTNKIVFTARQVSPDYKLPEKP